MKCTLETQRLLLRPFSVADAEDMYNGWATDPEVTKYVTWNPHADLGETVALLERWVAEYEKPERLNFAIERKEDGRLIGNIDVCGYLDGPGGTPVIGYCLARAYWGKGYMTEACRRLIDFLFEKGYKKIRIDALAPNAASNRVIQKCGGRFIGTEEAYLEKKGLKFTANRYVVEAPDIHCPCDKSKPTGAANEQRQND